MWNTGITSLSSFEWFRRRCSTFIAVSSQCRAAWSVYTLNSSYIRYSGSVFHAHMTARQFRSDDEEFSYTRTRDLYQSAIGFRSPSGSCWNSAQPMPQSLEWQFNAYLRLTLGNAKTSDEHNVLTKTLNASCCLAFGLNVSDGPIFNILSYVWAGTVKPSLNRW